MTDANFDRIARAEVEWNTRATGLSQSSTNLQQQIESIRGQRKFWYVLPLAAVPHPCASRGVVTDESGSSGFAQRRLPQPTSLNLGSSTVIVAVSEMVYLVLNAAGMLAGIA